MQTVDLILNGEAEEAENNAKWLELAKKLLGSNKNKFSSPIIIGLIGILLLCLGFLPYPVTHAFIKLKTNYINISLAENLDYGLSLDCKELDIKNLSNIEWGFKNWNNQQLEDAVISVIGEDHITLNLNELPTSSVITFDKQESETLNFYINNASFLGEVQVQKGTVQIHRLKIDTMINSNFLSVLHLERNNLGISTDFEATDVKSLETKYLVVDQLNFNKKISEEKFESGIIGGTINLTATGKEYKLRKRNVVELEIKKNASVFIEFLDDHMIVECEANVSVLNAGPKSFTKSLRPTILDYLHNNEKIAFYGSAIILLWGMLWSFKRTLID